MRSETRGLYSPQDTLWRIHSETLLMLGGSRALLLEMAHPLVAAGVAQHSNFRRQPLRRLVNTIRAMVMLTFGDARMAQVAARHTHHCHTEVHGALSQPVGEMAAGTPYDANDPMLRLWVFATLIDTTLLIHDQFVRSLDSADKSAYYQDSKRMAHMLGVPPAAMPADYAAFRDYFDHMISGPALSVGPQARDVVGALFEAPLFGLLARIGSYPGIGLLPERLRTAFGFPWTDRDQRRLSRLAALSRRLRSALPDVLCTFPAASYYAFRYQHPSL